MIFFVFFFNDTATTEIYTLSLHDALPISAIDQFIKIKKRVGEDIGVKVRINRLKESINQDSLEEEIKKIAKKSDGIIIQLPLPFTFSTDEILNIIPKEKDVDVLRNIKPKNTRIKEQELLPPVVGAIKEIFDRYAIELKDKKIVIIGKGRLVGKPVLQWIQQQGINPVVLEKGDIIAENLANADIIISGAGSPGLIKPEMLARPSKGEGGLKDGVILIDAGISEISGKIKGDADPECASKCNLFTPVPGGIGPIVVVMLFKNLVTLIQDTNQRMNANDTNNTKMS